MASRLVLHAGGRDWRASELSAVELAEMVPHIAVLLEPDCDLRDRLLAFCSIIGPLFVPLNPDLTPRTALKLLAPQGRAIADEIWRQARAARRDLALLRAPIAGTA